MQTPVQVTFHQLPVSPSLESEIRDSVDDLEKVFDRIVSCRVSVEAPHRHHHRGWLYRVQIEIGVPGDRIVVESLPEENMSHADPHFAVRDGFRVARRRLEDYVRRLQDVRAHAT